MDGIKCVLLDIEGTICPISFVKDTLFPYALKALPDVLTSRWDDEEFKPYKEAFPDDAQASPAALRAHVEDLTKRDVKVAYHKNLQGYLWESGYKTGAYSTPLFPDVVPKLKQWKDEGLELAIYSSGSVFAQKLLFGHVQSPKPAAGQKRDRPATEGEEENAEPPVKKQMGAAKDGEEQSDSESKDASDGLISKNDELSEEKRVTDEGTVDTEDLQHLISDWFDTTNAGLKAEASSYERIAGSLKIPPSEILFLSDNVKEVDAAVAAGMKSIMVDRPGNAPLSDDDRARLEVVESLSEIS